MFRVSQELACLCLGVEGRATEAGSAKGWTGWRVEDGALYAARLVVKLNACRPTIKPTGKRRIVN